MFNVKCLQNSETKMLLFNKDGKDKHRILMNRVAALGCEVKRLPLPSRPHLPASLPHLYPAPTPLDGVGSKNRR